MADNIAVTEGAGKNVATDDVGGAQYQRVKLDYGGNGVSIPFEGTIPEITNLAGGTVTLANPTGTTVTVDHGTVTLSNPTGTTVTVDHGTVTLSNPTGTTVQFNNGTIDSVANIVNLAKGTITRVEGGTITLSNPTGTTVQFNNGTIDSVTNIANLAKGTITRVEGGTITLSNPTGTTVQFNNGTVDLIEAGTVTRLEQGSVNVTAGTIRENTTPLKSMVTMGTTFTGTIGTIVAAPGSGTSLWITSLSVIAHSGTPDIAVSFGLQNNGPHRLVRGQFFTPGGGVEKRFRPATNGGTTNSALTWNQLSSSGSVSIDVSYWVE